ncbi:MAG: hypothetical protein AAF267_25485 [Deinococcota bacterium]
MLVRSFCLSFLLPPACDAPLKALRRRQQTKRLEHHLKQLCKLYPELGKALDEFERADIQLHGAKQRGETPSSSLLLDHRNWAEMVAGIMYDLRYGEVDYGDDD